jgi:hypothetical protein
VVKEWGHGKILTGLNPPEKKHTKNNFLNSNPLVSIIY